MINSWKRSYSNTLRYGILFHLALCSNLLACRPTCRPNRMTHQTPLDCSVSHWGLAATNTNLPQLSCPNPFTQQSHQSGGEEAGFSIAKTNHGNKITTTWQHLDVPDWSTPTVSNSSPGTAIVVKGGEPEKQCRRVQDGVCRRYVTPSSSVVNICTTCLNVRPQSVFMLRMTVLIKSYY
jgi:hypothetical protein